MKFLKTLVSVAVVSFLSITSASAAEWENRSVYTAEGVVKFIPDDITASELSKILFPAPRPLTRSIVNPTETPVVSVAMLIQFEFDSAELTAESKDRLNIIGELLNTDDALDKGLTIEGHTDIIGSSEYNMQLSRKRADSVKNYLISAHDIGVARLNTVGRGESSLIDPTNPKGPINRRVQFTSKS